MAILKRVHALGIQHGDFAERNVVQRHGSWITRLIRPRYVVIDFSHACTGHQCRGKRCPELQDAMKQLGLTSDDISFQSRSSHLLTMHSYYPIFKMLATAIVLAATWTVSGLGWQWRG